MGVSFQLSQPDETHAPGRKRDDNQHGGDGGHTEGRGHQDDPEGAVLGGRIHNHGNQGLAGPEYKNGEEHPGSDIGLFTFRLMEVGVLFRVMVMMLVLFSVRVEMDVPMRPVSDGTAQAPQEIGEPEADEQPGGQASPGSFDVLQPEHGHSQGDPQESQGYGAQDMTQAAEEGHEQGFGQAPPPGAADHDEGKIVIRPHQGVDEPDAGGGAGYHQDLMAHAGLQKKWWTVGDSNPRPQQCERCALPTELTAHLSENKGFTGLADLSPSPV